MPIVEAQKNERVSARIEWVLAISGLLAVYFVPQLLEIMGGQVGGILITWDESWYGARMVRVLQGFVGTGNAFSWEGRNDPTVVPVLAESLVASFGWLWNHTIGLVSPKTLELSPVALITISRAVFSCGIFYLLTSSFRFLGMSRRMILIAALSAMVDPGLIKMQPFFLGLPDSLLQPTALPLNRFANPLINLTFFLAAWRLSARVFADQQIKFKWIVAAGFLMGLLFYVSVYYWTHLALSLMLFTLATRTRRNWTVLLGGALVATSVALPYFVSHRKLSENPNYADWIWRHGMFEHNRNWWVLSHKSLWLWFAITLPWAWSPDPRRRFAFCSVFGGLLLYLSPIATGIDFQAWHWWHYTTAPLLWITGLWAAAAHIKALLPQVQSRLDQQSLWINRVLNNRALVSALTMLSILGYTAYGLTVSLRQHKGANAKNRWSDSQGVGELSAELFPIFDWLKAHARPDAVILSELPIMANIPLRTGLWAWVDHHLTADLTSSTELFNRNLIWWRLKGYSFTDIIENSCPATEQVCPVWAYGLPDELHDDLVRRGKPTFSTPIQKELAVEVANLYTKLGTDAVVNKAKQYKMDYALLPSSGWSGARSILQMRPILRVGAWELNEIQGFKQ